MRFPTGGQHLEMAMTEQVKKSRGKPRQTKDRVLQARIPQQLDEELREHAEHLGLSVSTVVRNVLLNTFQLVEDVVADSTKLARVINRRKPHTAIPQLALPTRAEDEAAAGVVGWQEAVLNLNGICDQCNTILRRGERAAMGVPAQARAVLLCLPCLAALSNPDGDRSRETN